MAEPPATHKAPVKVLVLFRVSIPLPFLTKAAPPVIAKLVNV